VGTITSASSIAAGFNASTLPATDPNSFSSIISAGPGQPGTANNNFVAAWGSGFALNGPLQTVTGSKVITEDLWTITRPSTAAATAWQYDGYFTLDLSGSSPSLIYNAAAPVPEPSTYGLIAGAGLLVMSLRRQWTQKNV
jgi:hypothetical protein